LCAFVTGPEAEEQLKPETVGSFIIRLSERLDGEFVISYKHQTGVRHYLIQPNDTADKKKDTHRLFGSIQILYIHTAGQNRRRWQESFL